MTDTRKPYDPAWPHGFETRDERKVEPLTHYPDARGWRLPDTGLRFATDEHGKYLGNPRYDIYCTSAPVEKPLECWVNVSRSGFLEGPYVSERDARVMAKAKDILRIAVHMREVTSEPAAKEPGGLSAAEVEKLATRWSGWWRHDGCSVMWHDAADALRSAARGEW